MSFRETVGPLIRLPVNLSRAYQVERDAQRTSSVARSSAKDYASIRQVSLVSPRLGKMISQVASRPRTRPRPSPTSKLAETDTRLISVREVSTALSGLGRNGFYRFERLVDSGVTSSILDHALSAPCTETTDQNVCARYPRESPECGRYFFTEQECLNNIGMQEFATDPLILQTAQGYLKVPPVLDLVTMWWNTTAEANELSRNAQLFHADLDRLSFVKFFLYLTDVTGETGPHVYVPGSHRRQPMKWRVDRRLQDHEIQGVKRTAFGRAIASPVQIVGPAGTLLAVDTRGIHKGAHPLKGDRLIAQLEYSSSLAGAAFETPVVQLAEGFRDRVETKRSVYRRWCLGGP